MKYAYEKDDSGLREVFLIGIIKENKFKEEVFLYHGEFHEEKDAKEYVEWKNGNLSKVEQLQEAIKGMIRFLEADDNDNDLYWDYIQELKELIDEK